MEEGALIATGAGACCHALPHCRCHHSRCHHNRPPCMHLPPCPCLPRCLQACGCCFERVRRDVRQLAAAGQRGIGSTFPCPCGCGQTQTKEPPTGCAWEVVYCICELMDDVGARGGLYCSLCTAICDPAVRLAGCTAFAS
jgi:hypothetical protein